MRDKQNAIVFASGTKDGGGSGFRNLVRYSRHTGSGYRICAVVSNHKNGGVRKIAEELGVPFEYFPGPWSAEAYERIVAKYKARWIFCSGWLKRIPIKRIDLIGWLLSLIGLNKGLDRSRTINIHPALLSFQNGRFGGPGKYGHFVHEDVAEALERGELDERVTGGSDASGTLAYSGFTMHFVTERFDDPAATFAEIRIPIRRGMSIAEIQQTVNDAEHAWQPLLTDMVVRGDIKYVDGKVIVPLGYGLLPK
jgi:folate-dependent phosphoribosylglycinamide formyltransferase PurN